MPFLNHKSSSVMLSREFSDPLRSELLLSCRLLGLMIGVRLSGSASLCRDSVSSSILY
eukprot:07631.XXX_443280_443453_1 [CDS] Oithona nana genome sequencing.